jgi:hypothetical protein
LTRRKAHAGRHTAHGHTHSLLPLRRMLIRCVPRQQAGLHHIELHRLLRLRHLLKRFRLHELLLLVRDGLRLLGGGLKAAAPVWVGRSLTVLVLPLTLLR